MNIGIFAVGPPGTATRKGADGGPGYPEKDLNQRMRSSRAKVTAWTV
jgi:hypothetical protein